MISLLDFSEIFREVSIYHGRTYGIGLISGKNLKIAHLGGSAPEPELKNSGFWPLKVPEKKFFQNFVFGVQLGVLGTFSENFMSLGPFLLISWLFSSKILAKIGVF